MPIKNEIILKKGMTVHELKKALESYDDDAMVCVPAQYGGYHHANTIEAIEVALDPHASDREGEWTDFYVEDEETTKAIVLLARNTLEICNE